MHIRKLLLIIFLRFSFSMNSQYLPLPLDADHYWQQSSIVKTTAGTLANCYYFLKVNKDSLINGKVFKYITMFDWGCNPYTPYVYPAALIRQDTALKIVTLMHQGTEKIIYNFNKNVGDTAMLYNAEANVTITHTLVSRNTFTANDGIQRRRFVYNNRDAMMEGIGSERGLLTPWNTFEKHHSIECLWNITSLSTIFNAQSGTVSCPLPLGLQNRSTPDAGISIYPNPSRSQIQVTSENYPIISLQITTIQGKAVVNINELNQMSATVDFTSLPPGIYFVKVKTDGFSAIRRLVIE
jgi:hypothetical protein